MPVVNYEKYCQMLDNAKKNAGPADLNDGNIQGHSQNGNNLEHYQHQDSKRTFVSWLFFHKLLSDTVSLLLSLMSFRVKEKATGLLQKERN